MSMAASRTSASMMLSVGQRLCLALIFSGFPSFAQAQTPAQRSVGSAQELTEALSAGVTRIELRPGSYREITISRHRPTAKVVFSAADPANPPVVHKLTVTDSSNLSFRNWRLTPHPEDGAAGTLATVGKSSGITFEAMQFSMEGAPSDRRWRGLGGAEIDGLEVRDTTFEGLDRAVVLERSRNATIAHNLFGGLGNAGLNLIENEAVVVDRNRFRGFRVQPGGTGTFIHAWTRGTSRPSRGLTFSNNVMVQDTATLAQGIFMSNEARIPFEDVTIVDNLVVVGTPHAISLDRAKDIRIGGNVALDTVDSIYNAAIRLSRSTNAEVTGNLAVAFGMIENRDVKLRRNATAARLERRARQLFITRIENGLAGRGDGRIHAQHMVTTAQREAGPRR